MKTPLVSVIMPTYNEKPIFVNEAVKSILDQTMTDFELLIIDDSTREETLRVIDALAQSDKRIKVIRSPQRLGLVGARNKGLEEALGNYIAFLDGDDIASPDRLEKQVCFLEENPEIGLCGSWATLFGDKSGKLSVPIDHEMLKISILFQNPIITSSVVIRKSVLEGMKFADSKTEDYDLWIQLNMKKVKMHNIPQYLVSYRTHADNTSNKAANLPYLKELCKLQLDPLDIRPSEEEMKINMTLTDLPSLKKESFPAIADWFRKLRKANGRKHIYPRDAFVVFILFRWILACIYTKRYIFLLWSIRIAGRWLFHPVVIGKLFNLMAEKRRYK